jgi:hypothetical protein
MRCHTIYHGHIRYSYDIHNPMLAINTLPHTQQAVCHTLNSLAYTHSYCTDWFRSMTWNHFFSRCPAGNLSNGSRGQTANGRSEQLSRNMNRDEVLNGLFLFRRTSVVFVTEHVPTTSYQLPSATHRLGPPGYAWWTNRRLMRA